MAPQLSADVVDPIRVFIVEDQTMVAQLLDRTISDQPGMTVVGMSSGVTSVLADVQQHLPDVVLMDFNLPDGDGVTGGALIKEHHPEVKVVILTGTCSDQIVRRAVDEGMDGLVRKTVTIAEMTRAVQDVHAGGVAFATSDLATALRGRQQRDVAVLSDRERDVLQLLAAGAATAEIAETLFISVHTVRSHVRSILGKMDAHSKLEAVAKAHRCGLIDPPR